MCLCVRVIKNNKQMCERGVESKNPVAYGSRIHTATGFTVLQFLLHVSLKISLKTGSFGWGNF